MPDSNYGNTKTTTENLRITGQTINVGLNQYILPATGGTVSLKSDLTSYLPIAGGTMTGNIIMGNSSVITTGATSTGTTINFNYSGLGKDMLISTDGASESEAGIFISNENGQYGLTTYVDSYNANVLLEKTVGYTAGNGYRWKVKLRTEGTDAAFIPFIGSDLSSKILRLGSEYTQKYGYVSIADIDEQLTFLPGTNSKNSGAGSIHAPSTSFVIGVNNSVAIGVTGATVKSSNTTYINRLGHTETSSIEGLLEFPTLSTNRNWNLPDKNGEIVTRIKSSITTNTGATANVDSIDTLVADSTHIIEVFVSTKEISGSNYGAWKRTLVVTTSGTTPTIQSTTNDVDSYSGFVISDVGFNISGTAINIGVTSTGGTANWDSKYEIINTTT